MTNFIQYSKNEISSNSLYEIIQSLNPKTIPKRPLRIFLFSSLCCSGSSIFVGKVASGSIKVGQQILIAPVNVKEVVLSLQILGKDVAEAHAGDIVGIRVGGIYTTFKSGYVIGDVNDGSNF